MAPLTCASLPTSLLELVFLALDPAHRCRLEAVCRRWRAVSRRSALLWDSVSWIGSTDAVQQAASLASFVEWICSRTLPPRQLRLHLLMDMGTDWLQPLDIASTWVHLGVVVATCAPRLQQLTIVQDYPGSSLADAVNSQVLMLCLPELGAWLLPCTELQRLELVVPHIELADGVLARLPALQHLRPAVNMMLYGEEGGFQVLELLPSQLSSSSLTSLDLYASRLQLQAGVLAGLPRLRRLVASNIHFPHTDEDDAAAEPEDFEILAECAGSLEELQLFSFKQVVPLQLGALSRLRRLLFSGLYSEMSLQKVQQLGQALGQLPLLEALSLAGNDSGLAPLENQQRLWAAWQPAPHNLRSLEVQCGAAHLGLPPEAAPHLAHLHTLYCDWSMLCASPGALGWCSQLRRLHILVNGPPTPGGRPRPLPAVPRSVVLQLAAHLAAMPHLTHLHLFNFKHPLNPAGEPPPVPAAALELLAEARARLPPGVHIPPVTPVGHPNVQLGLWEAS